MKKHIFIFFVFILLFSLSACSLKEDVEELYEKETPLEAEIITPDSFSKNKEETIKVVLTQDSKIVENADYVHFEIWKQDGSVHYDMEQANENGKGTYSLSKSFDQDGLYFIQVHASSNGSIIIPQKQFIVGELSESEKEFLKDGTQKQETNHEHHH
jgi:hypothetical protein